MQDDVGKLVEEQMARSLTADDGFQRAVRTGTPDDVSSANETFHEAIDEAGQKPVAAERPAEKTATPRWADEGRSHGAIGRLLGGQGNASPEQEA